MKTPGTSEKPIITGFFFLRTGLDMFPAFPGPLKSKKPASSGCSQKPISLAEMNV
jgi:hypothetical protein